mmetsp:Transcript_14229/g.24242  ORF Transcript_14229/g.24242 Transcript_14229/m.24242 type:complete len:344 (+) Transcript_14229:112-1143(+)
MAPAEANLVLSCTFYMISSAGMSIFNKLAVQALGLPIAIVVIQMGFTVVTCAASPSSIHIGSLRDALRWGLTVPMLFAAMLVSSMIAMQYNTLGTVVVFRNIAPLITLAIESMFRIPMVVSRDTLLALLTIVVGVGTYYANLFSLSRVGLAAILANMAFAVLERLTQRYLMAQSPVDLSKPAMMLLNNAFGLVPGVALLFAYGEASRLSSLGSLSAYDGCIVLLSCLNGLAISYAGLRVQQLVTATTFMVLTNVNKFAVIAFGVLFLRDDITVQSACGMLLAIGGGVWYGRARAAVPAAPPPPRTRTPSPPLKAKSELFDVELGEAEAEGASLISDHEQRRKD